MRVRVQIKNSRCVGSDQLSKTTAMQAVLQRVFGTGGFGGLGVLKGGFPLHLQDYSASRCLTFPTSML